MQKAIVKHLKSTQFLLLYVTKDGVNDSFVTGFTCEQFDQQMSITSQWRDFIASSETTQQEGNEEDSLGYAPKYRCNSCNYGTSYRKNMLDHYQVPGRLGTAVISPQYAWSFCK